MSLRLIIEIWLHGNSNSKTNSNRDHLVVTKLYKTHGELGMTEYFIYFNDFISISKPPNYFVGWYIWSFFLCVHTQLRRVCQCNQ